MEQKSLSLSTTRLPGVDALRKKGSNAFATGTVVPKRLEKPIIGNTPTTRIAKVNAGRNIVMSMSADSNKEDKNRR
jgi:hypothetical protein